MEEKREKCQEKEDTYLRKRKGGKDAEEGKGKRKGDKEKRKIKRIRKRKWGNLKNA